MKEEIDNIKIGISLILNNTNAYKQIENMCKQDLKHFDIEEFAESIEERIEEFLEDEFIKHADLEDSCDFCGHDSIDDFCSKECSDAFNNEIS
tara:strand:- start:1679 stop:1957 length:279 start_codon:yes stop_codon:yes gene_type:complete